MVAAGRDHAGCSPVGESGDHPDRRRQDQQRDRTQGRAHAERFASEADHLIVSRRGRLHGPVDAALADLGLSRRVVGTVGTFPASLFVIRDTDLVGLLTSWTLPLATSLGLVAFDVPLPLPRWRWAWPGTRATTPTPPTRGCGGGVRELLSERPEGTRPTQRA